MIVFPPSVRALFDLGTQTAVSAGAGSGKTTALVELCVRLLSGEALGTPCEPSQIVAITFTERAGAELDERLRRAVGERLGQAAAPESAALWRARLMDLDRLAVGTIHGFCMRLLREHAPEAGLDPDFIVQEEDRASEWLFECARTAALAALDRADPVVRELSARDGLDALARETASLVKARATRGERGPVNIADGEPARVLEERDRLLELASVLAGAGASCSPRVAGVLAALTPKERNGPLHLGTLSALQALYEASKGRAAKEARAVRDELLSSLERCMGEAADVIGCPQRLALAALVEEAEALYLLRKRESRVVDFDDLLVYARDLLSGDPTLRRELRLRLRALLVDEYQDVNGVQQALFDLLAGSEPDSAGPVLVAVGDAKQSIYRFRGADLSVFTRLLRRFEAGEGRVLHQSDNHRSAPGVVELVNNLFERLFVVPEGSPPADDELVFEKRTV